MPFRQSAAFGQLLEIWNVYKNILPTWTFPFLTLCIAAVFQSFAWMSGPIFLSSLSLVPRILVLWLFAAGEYIFMSITMNLGVEVLKMSEPLLVVVYQVMTLFVFMFIDIFVFKKEFRFKYFVSFVLLSLAVYVAYMF
jgi:uncharacterized protein (DUF486 family)